HDARHVDPPTGYGPHTGDAVHEHEEEHEVSREQDLRKQPDAEPYDQKRGDGDARDRVDHEHERLGDRVGAPGETKGDRRDDTRDGADDVSEYRLLDREPHVDGEGP